jgi:tRNA (cmo5U34)-methyltransferase
MSEQTNTDKIYGEQKGAIAPFKFNEEVVKVFPDMIERSVPGYGFMLPLIGLIADRYSQPHSNIYDLGASLGAATFAMAHYLQRPGCRIVAVDNSQAMVTRLNELLAAEAPNLPIETKLADIRDCEIERASVVILNFTLQFISPAERDSLLAKIYQGLLPGGVVVLSEKVVFADGEQNGRFINLHHDFKRANGYSELEISQKRTALENVLIPETIAQHQARLQQSGFATAEVWFQAFNFASILAVK